MDAYEEELRTERAMRDRFMAHHAESPFLVGRVDGFHGLRYFPIDPKLRVAARLDRVEAPGEAYLRTNRDGQAVMRYLGDLKFRIGERELHLRVYHAGEGVGTSVFVPFRDGTSGTESYGPGRYLTLDLDADDAYELDFNRAFNPYCAYTDAYECPFPPAENDLPVRIDAGEMAWSDARNPATPQGAVRSLRAGGRPSAPPRAKPKPRRAAPASRRAPGRARPRPKRRTTSRRRG